jgi:hypothetical protein
VVGRDGVFRSDFPLRTEDVLLVRLKRLSP